MTDKNILKEVKKWQELLDLTEWVFIVQPVKRAVLSDNGELAQCIISQESMSCTVILAIELPDDEIRKSVRHELLHVALNELRSTCDDAIGLLGLEASTMASNLYNKNEEKLVIKLERLIDKLFADDVTKTDE